MATNQHTTTEELLEVVFSVVCTVTIAIQQQGKHASTTIEELFSTWSMPVVIGQLVSCKSAQLKVWL
jgi:hypothetical protein